MFKNKIFKRLRNAVSKSEEVQSTPPSTSDLEKGDRSEAADTKINIKINNPRAEANKIDTTLILRRIAAQKQLQDKAHVNAGVKAYANKEYDEAISHYKEALAINPTDGSLYNNIGNVYLRGKDDPEAALDYYVQATTIEPSFNYGWYNLALCQKALGDISGAKETVSKGLDVLNSEDELYEVLTQLQSQLE